MTFTLKIATCHPHFWWNGWDHLHAPAITQGWKGYRKKSQHRNLTLEKKFSHRSCWDLNQRPFNHRSILLPYPHLSSKNDATYAVWISSNFLWLANSLNISTFLHYGMGGTLCLTHVSTMFCLLAVMLPNLCLIFGSVLSEDFIIFEPDFRQCILYQEVSFSKSITVS